MHQSHCQSLLARPMAANSHRLLLSINPRPSYSPVPGHSPAQDCSRAQTTHAKSGLGCWLHGSENQHDVCCSLQTACLASLDHGKPDAMLTHYDWGPSVPPILNGFPCRSALLRLRCPHLPETQKLVCIDAICAHEAAAGEVSLF